MYKEIVVILLLTLCAFIEGSVTSIPLVLVFLITIAASTKSPKVYLYSLLAGCIIDILTGRTLGVTSLVFVLLLFTIFLYQRKYEINSYLFIGFATGILSLMFGLIFPVSSLIMHTMTSVLLGQTFFLFWKVLYLKESTPESYL